MGAIKTAAVVGGIQMSSATIDITGIGGVVVGGGGCGGGILLALLLDLDWDGEPSPYVHRAGLGLWLGLPQIL